MMTDPDILVAFRKQVSAARSSDAIPWDNSRHLVHPTQWSTTRPFLLQAVADSAFPEGVKRHLVTTLSQIDRPADSDRFGKALKQLTGLPPTKALRALCVLFKVPSAQPSKWPVPTVPAEAVEKFLQDHSNPFDLLTEQVPASVLDLGAGDLSLAEELAACYAPQPQC